MFKLLVFKTTLLLLLTIFTFNNAFSQGNQSLWGWGANSNGQLGLGNTTQQNSPELIVDSNEFRSIAAGYGHTALIKKDGTLWTWGYNYYGQLGLGNTTDYNTPQQVGTDTTWTSISSGGYHTVAVKKDRTLWTWGQNGSGQLGLGNTTDFNTPQQVGTDTTWASISAGGAHTVAIKKDGSLWTWGDNVYGELGLGNTIFINTPQQVGTDTTWASISAGGAHTVAIKKDSTLWAWGSNDRGQLGLGNTTNYNTPQRLIGNQWKQVYAGYYYTIAIGGSKNFCGNKLASLNHKKFSSDTILMCYDDIEIKTTNKQYSFYRWKTGQNQDSINLTRSKLQFDGYQYVYMDNDSFCAVDSVYVKVFPNDLKLTSTTFEISIVNNLKDTILDLYKCFGIHRDSGLKFYSLNNKSKIDSVIVKSGTNHKQTQQYYYGLNFSNLYCVPVQLDIIKGVSKQWVNNSLFLEDQSLWAWGNNSDGQLGLGNNTNSYNSPQIVLDNSDIKSISAGLSHTLAIKKDGTIWAWGRNFEGQLGLGNTTDCNTPQQVGLDTTWSSVFCGYWHTFAIKKDGSLWAWGYNRYGQLGIGNTNQYNSPKQIGSDTNWACINSAAHTIAIKKDGTLWAWGNNNYGQLGLGNTTQFNSPQQLGIDTTWDSISAGQQHTVAIKKDGTLWSWGYNGYGQLGTGDGNYYNSPHQVRKDNDWSLIAACYNQTAAIKKDGTLWACGENWYGQLGLGNYNYYDTLVQIGIGTFWSKVALGFYHTVAIKKDSSLWAWGTNYNNTPKQIGSDTTWTAITANYLHTVAIKTRKPCQISNYKSNKHVPLSKLDTLNACTSLKLTSKNKKYKSYRWSNGDTTFYTSVNTSKSVILREIDSKGCTNFDTVYVRLLKDVISQAPDTSICSVTAKDTLKLNLNNWFGKADYNFYNRLKIQSTTADVFIKNSASKKWTGLAALKSNSALKCPVSGNIYPSVVYPRLVNKLTDTILTTKSALKPSVVDKKYTKYTWSNNDTTWTTNFTNSGNYWFKHMDSVGCSQTDTFHFSRINLTIPSKITAKFGSKILLKVKDSLNTSSYVVWSTGDTSWHTIYTVTKNTDTIFATQQDGYRSVTKFTVITGRLEPIRTIEEYDNFDNDSAGNTKSQNNTAGIEVSNLINLRIYPNPVGSEITLEGLTHPMNYEIHTVTGQLVQSGKTSSKINVETLESGIYILKLENVSVKFVKE